MKRTVDVVGGAVLAVLALPIILLAAIGVMVTLRAWPFFVQDRIGRDGRVFRFFKLRTLPTHHPRYADKYSLSDLELPALSRLLRRTHLDELPQLLLVPLGYMSLVGPRPEMPTLHNGLPREFASARTSLRPGLTGLWQISRDSHRLIGEAPEYDIYYLGHQNVLLDLWVLARTAGQLLGPPRLISLTDVPQWARREDAIIELPKAHLDPVLSTVDAA